MWKLIDRLWVEITYWEDPLQTQELCACAFAPLNCKKPEAAVAAAATANTGLII